MPLEAEHNSSPDEVIESASSEKFPEYLSEDF